MEEAGVQLIAQGINVYLGDMKSATNATNTFVDATEKGGGRVSAAGQIMTGALRQVGVIATEAFAQAAKATLSFVKDSVDLAGDFESGMLNFQAVAGKDVDTSGLEDFRDLFIDIGKRLPVSTTEVQQAATEMVKGGIDPAALAAGGLEQNIQFAAAAMEGDLVKAAEISSKILGGWAGVNATASEKADFLTHSTDMLTKAANASATDVEGLSLGIFNAQGIARTAGVSFDDLTTTLAALAPRFESSSVAGNSLKNMIARLQPTTDPAAAAMASLGLYTEETGSAFYDAAGNFVGFETAAQLLQESLAGLTNEQKAATLQQIFGNDAMGAAAGLAELGAQGYSNMAEALANANGVADAAALKQQGYATSLDNAKGSVEALQITIGTALLPILSDLLDNVIAPGVNTLTDLASALFGDEEAFAKLSPTMRDVATTIQGLSDDFAKGMQIAQDIGAEIQSLIGTFNKAGGESGALGSAVDDLNGIWEKAQGVITNVMNAYMDIAESVLPIITQFVDDHGAEISAFFKASYDKIISIVNLALDIYNTVVPFVLGAIAQSIEDHSSEITKVLSGAWDLISGIITAALTLIEGLFKTTLALLKGDWEGAWTAIQEMSAGFVLALGKTIEGFLNIIAGFFDTSLSEIVTLWENNWNMLVDIATQTDWAAVGQNVVDGIKQGLIDAWSSLSSWLSDRVSSLVDDAMAAIGASSPAKEFMPVGQFAVMGIMEGFEQTWPSLTAQIAEMGDGLVDQVKDIAESVQGEIADAFGATASIDRQIAKNMEAVAKIDDDFYRNATENALRAAQVQAEAYADPETGAKFFKMKSAQILEFQELQQKINEEEDAATKRRLQAQQILILKAQEAEMSAFEATNSRTNSGASGLTSQVNDMLAEIMGIKLGKDQQHMITPLANMEDALKRLLEQLSGPLMNASAYASPPMQAGGYGGYTGGTTSNQRTYNMPIYTNNTPAALQHSLAIAEAMYP